MDFSKVIVKHRNRERFQRLFLNQPIKCLRRYGNNLQRTKKTPVVIERPALLLSTFLSTNEVRGN